MRATRATRRGRRAVGGAPWAALFFSFQKIPQVGSARMHGAARFKAAQRSAPTMGDV